MRGAMLAFFLRYAIKNGKKPPSRFVDRIETARNQGFFIIDDKIFCLN
jgi:hypothetical protein